MSAGEPEETDAYQEIFDDLINSEVDYEVDRRAGRRLRGAGPDPRRGRHPRGRGGAPARHRQADGGRGPDRQALEDLGVDVDAARGARGRGLPRARRVRGQALRRADQHQPQEHGLVPEGRLRRGRLRGARDLGRPHRPERPDRRRRRHARGASASRARAPPAGRPPTGWRTSCSAPRGPTSTTSGSTTRSPSTTLRSWTAGERFGEILFTDGYVLGGAAATADIAFGGRPGTAVHGPARVLPPPAGELHRRPAGVRGPGGRSRLRLVPAPAHRPGRHPLRR